MKVLHFPLTKLTVGFIFGLLLAHFYVFWPTIIGISLTVLLLLLCSINKFFKGKQQTTFFGLVSLMIMILIGIFTTLIHNDSFDPTHYSHNKTAFAKPTLFTLTVREKLKNSPFASRYLAQIKEIQNQRQNGSIILNIATDSLPITVPIGSKLKINGILIANKTARNPNQFDYGKYLLNKQIYAQLYSNPEDISISTSNEKDIWYYTARFRENIISNLKVNQFSNRELQVAIALILGQQQEIDPAIIRDYQHAGAVHILSVSGLHIGFIMLFMTFLLRPIPNNKRGSALKLVIILLSLWLFGILAGLAPSVVRSVTMFSFVAIGNHLGRNTSIYHTLIASIFIILLFEPSFLFDVGFQLSYVALFFIVWLQPLLATLWSPKYKVVRYFWDILTVSFAAQIGTLPLSIYYFHQFPGLFFITNLIIIPLLSFIMAIGIIVMSWAAFTEVPRTLSQILEWGIWSINWIISKIASVEQFILKDIPLHFYLLLCGYCIIVTVVLWFKKPSFYKLLAVMVSIIVTQSTYLVLKNQFEKQAEMIVFNTQKNTLISKRYGNIIFAYSKSDVKNNSSLNTLKSYEQANFSKINSVQPLKNVLFYKGKKIFILDSSAVWSPKVKPDILLLTQSTKVNLDRVLIQLHPKIVIADGSNYKKARWKWEQSCQKKNIPFHATAEKGYFKLN
ncbi:ComEC family competence protein [Flavobacterium sp. F-328]|uniref:ComEC family competence protein n=1 Tax=Flavobacterium erciyesense TaxID=2825842 RepID=A0ABS5D5P9_9FLAO|nr:ComEC/Rec2 family competence protein [Flavobacterium erciyesense]MBQ0909368.1 ComEC family competence protein [Flavobacterium erciyesense]